MQNRKHSLYVHNGNEKQGNKRDKMRENTKMQTRIKKMNDFTS